MTVNISQPLSRRETTTFAWLVGGPECQQHPSGDVPPPLPDPVTHPIRSPPTAIAPQPDGSH
ncbi:hypothetical protein HQ394_08835 [Defluviicoccus vanus]|uniref:Uncharacterized protein n=1 Tax=Defluviicoccus vanus TaxID=111831 RepID=A0A7H1N119_9PROT|nr:hypothetical protein HQ394_08835 [Defluviicoccus vanus]